MTSNRLRTNPFLSVMPRFDGDEPEFVIRDFRSNRSYEIPSVTLLELLGEASEWVERETLRTLAEKEYELSEEAADSVIEMLERQEFLVPSDSEVFELERERDRWRESGWGVAFDYYVCIRDYPYYDDNEPESILERIGKRAEQNEAVPSLYKKYEDALRVDLGDVDESTELESVRTVLTGDRPDRDEQKSSVDTETLSETLFYTFGETGRQSLEELGEFLLKTSPSGGSRHPTEAYVATFDVDGIERGVYHYSVENHELERLGTPNEVIESLERRRDSTVDTPSFVVIFTSILARDMWKYRDPRAFRIPNHDVGHLMETFRLVCRASGLSVAFEQEYDEERLATQLGIDRLTEPIFACASVE